MFPKGATGTQDPYACWEGVPRETSVGKRHAQDPRLGHKTRKGRSQLGSSHISSILAPGRRI